MQSFSVLKDRLLQWDGKSIIEPESIADLLLNGVTPDKILTTEISEEVELFNQMSDVKIDLYDENKEVKLDFSWQLPQKYLELDLIEYFSHFITPKNEERICEELELVMKFQIENEMRTIIYVVDILKDKKVVFGVGRGSSCASYLLYCIGIHQVDCLKYDIPASEFFH